MPVYLIRAGEDGPVKIGWAVDVKRRVRVLQTSHHQKLTVLRTWDGRQPLEGMLHKRFAASRLHREWFSFDPAMLSIDADDITPEATSLPTEAEADAALAEVERFLIATQMTPTAFGRRALNDPTLVHDMRRGRECRRAVRSRILGFIEAETARNRAAA